MFKSPITIIDNEIGSYFVNQKDIIFKITSHNIEKPDIIKYSDSDLLYSGENYVIATTFQEFKEILLSHEYSPILFISNIQTVIAYLYGCLNFEFNANRPSIFIIWWRKKNTDKWYIWFYVERYKDFEDLNKDE